MLIKMTSFTLANYFLQVKGNKGRASNTYFTMFFNFNDDIWFQFFFLSVIFRGEKTAKKIDVA